MDKKDSKSWVQEKSLLTSMDKDGTKNGFDLEVIKKSFR